MSYFIFDPQSIVGAAGVRPLFQALALWHFLSLVLISRQWRCDTFDFRCAMETGTLHSLICLLFRVVLLDFVAPLNPSTFYSSNVPFF
jgi:hypothetical protein